MKKQKEEWKEKLWKHLEDGFNVDSLTNFVRNIIQSERKKIIGEIEKLFFTDRSSIIDTFYGEIVKVNLEDWNKLKKKLQIYRQI